MCDEDGVWRFHVMPCEGGWKVVLSGKTRSVHMRKGAAVAAATRAYKALTAKGERAGIVNHMDGKASKETLFGGPRKTRRHASSSSAAEAGAES